LCRVSYRLNLGYLIRISHHRIHHHWVLHWHVFSKHSHGLHLLKLSHHHLHLFRIELHPIVRHLRELVLLWLSSSYTFEALILSLSVFLIHWFTLRMHGHIILILSLSRYSLFLLFLLFFIIVLVFIILIFIVVNELLLSYVLLLNPSNTVTIFKKLLGLTFLVEFHKVVAKES